MHMRMDATTTTSSTDAQVQKVLRDGAAEAAAATAAATAAPAASAASTAASSSSESSPELRAMGDEQRRMAQLQAVLAAAHKYQVARK